MNSTAGAVKFPPVVKVLRLLDQIHSGNNRHHTLGISSLVHNSLIFVFGDTYTLGPAGGKTLCTHVSSSACVSTSFDISQSHRGTQFIPLDDNERSFNDERRLFAPPCKELRDVSQGLMFVRSAGPVVEVSEGGVTWFVGGRKGVNGAPEQLLGAGVAEVKITGGGEVSAVRWGSTLFTVAEPLWGALTAVRWGAHIYLYGSHPDALGGTKAAIYCARVGYDDRQYLYAENYEMWDGEQFVRRNHNLRLVPVMYNMQAGSVFHTHAFGDLDYIPDQEDEGMFVFVGCDKTSDSQVRMLVAPRPWGPWMGSGRLVDLTEEQTENGGPKTDIVVQLPFCKLEEEGLLTISFTDGFPGRVYVVEILLEMNEDHVRTPQQTLYDAGKRMLDALCGRTIEVPGHFPPAEAPPKHRHPQNSIGGIYVQRASAPRPRNPFLPRKITTQRYLASGQPAATPARPPRPPRFELIPEIMQYPLGRVLIATLQNAPPPTPTFFLRPATLASRRKAGCLTIMPCPPLLTVLDEADDESSPIPVPAGGILAALAKKRKQFQALARQHATAQVTQRLDATLDALLAQLQIENSNAQRERELTARRRECIDELLAHIRGTLAARAFRDREEDEMREEVLHKIQDLEERRQCRELCARLVSEQRQGAQMQLEVVVTEMEVSRVALGEKAVEGEEAMGAVGMWTTPQRRVPIMTTPTRGPRTSSVPPRQYWTPQLGGSPEQQGTPSPSSRHPEVYPDTPTPPGPRRLRQRLQANTAPQQNSTQRRLSASQHATPGSAPRRLSASQHATPVSAPHHFPATRRPQFRTGSSPASTPPAAQFRPSPSYAESPPLDTTYATPPGSIPRHLITPRTGPTASPLRNYTTPVGAARTTPVSSMSIEQQDRINEMFARGMDMDSGDDDDGGSSGNGSSGNDSSGNGSSGNGNGNGDDNPGARSSRDSVMSLRTQKRRHEYVPAPAAPAAAAFPSVLRIGEDDEVEMMMRGG